ncbi:hypothetical protein [Labedella endophytica]|nr:hypothetical protein [Labedella endophytica]
MRIPGFSASESPRDVRVSARPGSRDDRLADPLVDLLPQPTPPVVAS